MKTYYIKKKKKKIGVLSKNQLQSISIIELINLVIKKQNEKLLSDLSDYKNLKLEEKEEFVNTFLKVGYYTPIITEDINEEKSQYYILKKNIKNIKNKYRQL